MCITSYNIFVTINKKFNFNILKQKRFTVKSYLLVLSFSFVFINIFNVQAITFSNSKIDLKKRYNNLYLSEITTSNKDKAIAVKTSLLTTANSSIFIPNCTRLNSPLNNSSNISVSSNLSWNAVIDALGYIINVGTTYGGTEIADNIDVGSNTTYTPAADFPEDSYIYITITPYNALGNATSCGQERFRTQKLSPPSCTSFFTPINNSNNVAVNSNLSWNSVSNASGYFINIGTTPGGTDIENNLDIGNTTTYVPATNYPSESEIYITIKPYNTIGEASGCIEKKFTTETILPLCTDLVSPVNGETDVSVSSSISWRPVSNAKGYYITAGTFPAGTEFANKLDVGNVTRFIPGTNFPENQTIHVLVIPYNDLGEAIQNCDEETFKTTFLKTSCTAMNSPRNGENNISVTSSISWDADANATGYFINVGTTPSGTDIANNIDVGNTTTYTPSSNFKGQTTIYVTITPYNTSGSSTSCSEESFTTENLLPSCISFLSPLNRTTNISVNTSITWNAVTNATGYFINLGTTSGGTDIENGKDLGNTTTYKATSPLPSETTVYITIIPYNLEGNAPNCNEKYFTTEKTPPNCTSITAPLNNSKNVAVDSNISWNLTPNTTGYLVTIGTTPSGTDIANAIDAGNVSAYNPPVDFPDESNIYVTITPYNALGNATNCEENQFTTENRIIEIPKFFTPNGDGNHDYWEVKDPKNEIKVIYIFDRYGKLLKTLESNTIGWNGSLSGKKLLADDYWSLLELHNGETIRTHFTLKR